MWQYVQEDQLQHEHEIEMLMAVIWYVQSLRLVDGHVDCHHNHRSGKKSLPVQPLLLIHDRRCQLPVFLSSVLVITMLISEPCDSIDLIPSCV